MKELIIHIYGNPENFTSDIQEIIKEIEEHPSSDGYSWQSKNGNLIDINQIGTSFWQKCGPSNVTGDIKACHSIKAPRAVNPHPFNQDHNKPNSNKPKTVSRIMKKPVKKLPPDSRRKT